MNLEVAIALVKATGHAEYPLSSQLNAWTGFVEFEIRIGRVDYARSDARELASMAMTIFPELREPESRKE